MKAKRQSVFYTDFRTIIRLLVAVALLSALLGHGSVPTAWASPIDPLPDQPGFSGGKVLPGTANTTASPLLADLDRDGKQEIVVGSSDGWVYALSANGSLLWQFNAAQAVSAVASLPGGGAIEATPAAADLDNDGWPEVVVAVLASYNVAGEYNGGVVVLDHGGTLRPGWPRITLDNNRDGHPDGGSSSPALGDLDGDGDLEIVAASLDMRVYAWHHNGEMVAGWPRFVAETVFSSPALADLDDDGCLEVIIGVQAHDYPPMGLHDGGYLHVYRGDGSEQPGFPRYVDQTIDSSPAVGDINGDGYLDIVVGTGVWFQGKGFAIYAWDRSGNLLPGWPVSTTGYVLSSPALGDIDGDGQLEVVIGSGSCWRLSGTGCNTGTLYALNGDGSVVPGWPVVVQDNFGVRGPLHWASPALANFDSDSQPEVFINHRCDTVVYDGNGTQLTHVGGSPSDGKPTIWMGNYSCPFATPALGDIDNDGKLEIVRAGGDDPYNAGHVLVRVWESRPQAATVTWPMFRGNAAHTAMQRSPQPIDARVIRHDMPALMSPGLLYQTRITLENTGTAAWSDNDGYYLSASAGDALAVESQVRVGSGEVIAPGQQKTFAVQLRAPSTPGFYVTKWRIARNGSGSFGLGAVSRVKVSGQPAFYVLCRNSELSGGGVYAGGLASDVSAPANFENWWAAQSLGIVSGRNGQYFILDSYGTVWCGGNGDCFGSYAPWGTATQEMLLLPDGATYYVLDKYGRVYAGYDAYNITPAPPTFGEPIARSAALTPDQRGIYVLDTYGNVYTGGSAVAFSSTIPRFSDMIAKRIKLTADGRGYYVLDAYGRVWNGGAAPAIAANYAIQVGHDWARDFELTADGKGYYLLDKEGGIHTGGNAVTPTGHLPATFVGQDVALDLAVTDSRTPTDLTASLDALSFLMMPNQSWSATLQVGSSGSTINWTASTDASWLTVSPQSGSSGAILRITVTLQQAQLGQHEAHVLISSNQAGNSPLSIPVRVRVVSKISRLELPLLLR